MLDTPAGIGGITPLVQELLLIIERWRLEQHTDEIVLFHNRPLGGAAYSPEFSRLLPLDLDWLRGLEETAWPSRVLPTFSINRTRSFARIGAADPVRHALPQFCRGVGQRECQPIGFHAECRAQHRGPAG